MVQKTSPSEHDVFLEADLIALRERVRAFAQAEIAPQAARIDREAQFPWELYQRTASEGLVGFIRAESRGTDTLAWALVMEEIGAASAALADILLLSEMVTLILDAAGTQEQRELIPLISSGETLGAFALTEPNAGSDAASVETQAIPDDDDYLLIGTKAYINNATVADWAIVQAKTAQGIGTRGITAFLVKRGQFTSNPEAYDLMGQRGIAVGELYLEGCRVPRSAMVGKEGEGFKLAMRALDVGRIGIAAMAVGIARAAYEAAVDYAKQRRQFGQAIASFQGIQWMLADMATDIEAARLLVYHAARLRDAGAPFTRAAAMAKMRASDMAMQTTINALQIHGGVGYRKDLPLERFVRDAKITQIYEGTNQILRQVIARHVIS